VGLEDTGDAVVGLNEIGDAVVGLEDTGDVVVGDLEDGLDETGDAVIGLAVLTTGAAVARTVGTVVGEAEINASPFGFKFAIVYRVVIKTLATSFTAIVPVGISFTEIEGLAKYKILSSSTIAYAMTVR